MRTPTLMCTVHSPHLWCVWVNSGGEPCDQGYHYQRSMQQVGLEWYRVTCSIAVWTYETSDSFPWCMYDVLVPANSTPPTNKPRKSLTGPSLEKHICSDEAKNNSSDELYWDGAREAAAITYPAIGVGTATTYLVTACQWQLDHNMTSAGHRQGRTR